MFLCVCVCVFECLRVCIYYVVFRVYHSKSKILKYGHATTERTVAIVITEVALTMAISSKITINAAKFIFSFHGNIVGSRALIKYNFGKYLKLVKIMYLRLST